MNLYCGDNIGLLIERLIANGASCNGCGPGLSVINKNKLLEIKGRLESPTPNLATIEPHINAEFRSDRRDFVRELPQGGGISPLLSSFFLCELLKRASHDLREALDLKDDQEVKFLVYADDGLIYSNLSSTYLGMVIMQVLVPLFRE
jgi:hypothetical protein